VKELVTKAGSACLIGVGVGPGDPELLTLKAARMLGEADVVAHFAKAGKASNARKTVAQHLRPGVEELPFLYPVTIEIPTSTSRYRDAIRDFYDASAVSVARHLDAGRTVAVLSEGDPLFYGSYMHLHVRLAPRYRSEVVPGISAMSGCWSIAGAPIAQGDDVFVVLPATLPEAELERRLLDADATVLMKLGRHLEKVRRVLTRTGRLSRAIYVERGTTADSITMPLPEKHDNAAPYFSLVLVPGWEMRPTVGRT
jgi:precorrin-2/cobalt-factor-2 C20-methyltransferase